MLKKYESIKEDVFESLGNLIEADVNPKQAALDVISRYPVFVALFKVDQEMLQEMVEWMSEFAYYIKNKAFYKEQ